MNNLRRVPKSEYLPDNIKNDGLAICLDYWSEWMRHSDRDLGAKLARYNNVSPPIVDQSHDGYDCNDDAAECARAQRIAQATDAMIESLVPAQKYAIWKSRGFSSVCWKYNDQSHALNLLNAQEELRKKMSLNIALRAFF